MQKAKLVASWLGPWLPAGFTVDDRIRLAIRLVLLAAGFAAAGVVTWVTGSGRRHELDLAVQTGGDLMRRGASRPDHAPRAGELEPARLPG